MPVESKLEDRTMFKKWRERWVRLAARWPVAVLAVVLFITAIWVGLLIWGAVVLAERII